MKHVAFVRYSSSLFSVHALNLAKSIFIFVMLISLNLVYSINDTRNLYPQFSFFFNLSPLIREVKFESHFWNPYLSTPFSLFLFFFGSTGSMVKSSYTKGGKRMVWKWQVVCGVGGGDNTYDKVGYTVVFK